MNSSNTNNSQASPIHPALAAAGVEHIQLKVGLEIHVELATKRKMFAPSANIAHPNYHDAQPNTLTDPVVLGLPGALPVMNAKAIELAIMVGLAMNCTIPPHTRWDRKSYFYPDLPKGYQISQYDAPLCENGSVTFKNEHNTTTTIRVKRAHLEEDAGKLLHEFPGGAPSEHTLIDLNRAGSPLLEIVTEPDFTSADDAVRFCKWVRETCKFIGASEAIIEKGHIRFEPNINVVMTIRNADGSTTKTATPISEIKNLNSYKAVRAAIEHEQAEQPHRWLADKLEFSPGTKSTRGWDDNRSVTILQRSKEEAHDYRYFPDPDLPPLDIQRHQVDQARAKLGRLPDQRAAHYQTTYNIDEKSAQALTAERPVSDLFEQAITSATALGLSENDAAKLTANIILQTAAKHANERSRSAQQITTDPTDDDTQPTDHGARTNTALLPSDLGVKPAEIAQLANLRAASEISSNALDQLFAMLINTDNNNTPNQPPRDVRQLAQTAGLIAVKDTNQLRAWAQAAIDANPTVAEDVRAGKLQALGRLIGAVKQASSGAADPALAKQTLLDLLSPTTPPYPPPP